MTHNMKLQNSAFYGIKSGTKTIEVRLFDDKRKLLNINDEIVFSLNDDPTEQIKVKIISLSRFKTFEDLFNALNGVAMGWNKGDSTLKKISDIRKYYSKEDEKAFGVLAIHVELT